MILFAAAVGAALTVAAVPVAAESGKAGAKTGAKAKAGAKAKRRHLSRDELRKKYDGYDWPIFIKVDRLNIPVVHGDRVAGQIMLQLSIEVADNDGRDKVRAGDARLMNAFITELKSYADSRPNVLRGPNLRTIKRLLLESSHRILGPGVVQAILVRGMTFRRFSLPARQTRRSP